MFGHTCRIFAASKRFVTIENGLTNSSGRLKKRILEPGCGSSKTAPIQPR